MKITIVIYSTRTKKEPFTTWLEKLESKMQAIVFERLARVRLGNFGDCKIIKNGGGIWELRIDYGPGYRVYFGKEGGTIVVLLVGGSKGSQERDILKALQYWLDYKDSHD